MDRMDRFSQQFVMEMFMENDSVSAINRLVVAMANVINENNENISVINEVLEKEYCQIVPSGDCFEIMSVTPSLHRKEGFYENTVINYCDETFIDKFKMQRSTVKMLMNFLRDYITPDSAIPLDKKVHLFLWFLCNESSYSEIGNLFNLHKSSVSYFIKEIALILYDNRYNFITWPSIEEQHLTRLKVYSRFKYPNCVGFIDACRMKFGAKRKKRLKNKTLLLQAVCNEALMFIDIHLGDVGVLDKSQVLKDSPLANELVNFIDYENHILGNSEYKLCKNLIIPFSSEELLTSEEMKFNETHSRAHCYISHAFGLLRERFTQLNYLELNNPEVVNVIISAACVLHNFVLLHEGCAQVKDEPTTSDDVVVIDREIVKSAYEKRQFLCNYINYIECN